MHIPFLAGRARTTPLRVPSIVPTLEHSVTLVEPDAEIRSESLPLEDQDRVAAKVVTFSERSLVLEESFDLPSLVAEDHSTLPIPVVHVPTPDATPRYTSIGGRLVSLIPRKRARPTKPHTTSSFFQQQTTTQRRTRNKKKEEEAQDDDEGEEGPKTMGDFSRSAKKGKILRAKSVNVHERADEHAPISAAQRLESEMREMHDAAPEVQMVNGQIVLNTSSLVVQRNEDEPLDEDQVDINEDEIIDGANERISSRSFSTRVFQGKSWNEADTRSFYKGLYEFGTDFTMMSNIFPERSRRYLKLKFKREERLHPDLIELALSASKAMTDQNFQSILANFTAEEEAEEAKKEDESSSLSEPEEEQDVVVNINPEARLTTTSSAIESHGSIDEEGGEE